MPLSNLPTHSEEHELDQWLDEYFTSKDREVHARERLKERILTRLQSPPVRPTLPESVQLGIQNTHRVKEEHGENFLTMGEKALLYLVDQSSTSSSTPEENNG